MTRKSGFTLIELLVTVVIIGILTIGSVSTYDRFNNRQTLRQAALTLKNNLRLAQSNAMSASKPSAGCTQLAGYQVSFAQSSYAIQATCSPEGLAGLSTTVNLPVGASFVSVPATLIFGVLTSGISASETMTLTKASFNYAISVSTSGDINDLGFQ